jgi:probable HAF family extracellular repeat protein
MLPVRTTLATVVSFVVSCSCALGAPAYNVIDLGTLGSNTPFPRSINSGGFVVGYLSGSGRAFVYHSGSMTALRTLGGLHNSACAINDHGDIVGGSYTSNGSYRAFLFSNGQMTDLLGGLCTSDSEAYGINSSGQVVGHYVDSSEHGFVYDDGEMTVLPGISCAYAINDTGQVAGCAVMGANWHAFVYSESTMTDLGTLGGASSVATGLNDNGQVVGYADVVGGHSGPYHAFLYSAGTMTDLGTLGYSESLAWGINSAGQVVGSARGFNGFTCAFLYDRGQTVNLNTLIDPTSGWSLETATAINDLGWIVGGGSHNGQQAGFLLVPIPEPSVIVLFSIGAVSLFVFAWRRRQQSVKGF